MKFLQTLMDRRRFLQVSGTTAAAAGAGSTLLPGLFTLAPSTAIRDKRRAAASRRP